MSFAAMLMLSVVVRTEAHGKPKIGNMAVPPGLVVNFSFNPPVISIAGPVQESTIAKLNELLPRLATNSVRGRRSPPRFTAQTEPAPHVLLDMGTLVADETAQMLMMLSLLDCLEDEGGWGMRDSHAAAYDYQNHYTFMFTKKSLR
jgi:hypothetical protein